MSGLGARLRDAGRLLAPKVAQAVADLPAEALTPADAATAALAMEYARAIDEAVVLHQIAEALAEEAEDHSRELYRLMKAVEHAEVLANLGPKLLATLQQLGCTPAARASVAGGKPAAAGRGGTVSALASIRGDRPGRGSA